MAWGIFEERDDLNYLVAFHTIPMIKIDGELHRSAAHDLSDTCPCHPKFSKRPDGIIVWNHHDPDHDEIQEEKQEVH